MEYFLLTIRMMTILIWSSCIINGIDIAVPLQGLMVFVIIGSDIFDGIISRARGTERGKMVFRIADAVVDKVGMGFFAAALYISGRIYLSTVLIVLVYNMLVGASVWLIFRLVKHVTLEKIQATSISRLQALSVGLLFFMLCNIKVKVGTVWIVNGVMLAIEVAAYTSHIMKEQEQIKEKVVFEPNLREMAR